MSPTTIQVLTVSVPVIVAVLTLAGIVWGKKLSRKVDDATASKLTVDAAAVTIDSALKVAAEVKSQLVAERVRADERERAMTDRINGLQSEVRGFETRQAMLLGALAAHAPWDAAAFDALLAHFPNYPPPPPLHPDGKLTGERP